MIECTLRNLREFHSALDTYNPKKTKKGLYSRSNFFSIKGYGRDKWVVIAHIDVDYKKYVAEGLAENTIFNNCIEHLNLAPPRKKYAKKTPKPLYGELRPHKAIFKEDEQGLYIEAYLTTDQRKNKNFWGEGRTFRKRKRKTKK
jgi:hypothetical protein